MFTKTLLCLLFTVLPFVSHSQIPASTYPFDLTILERQATYADIIMPTGKAGKFTYINTKTGRPAFKGIYDCAYPFVKMPRHHTKKPAQMLYT